MVICSMIVCCWLKAPLINIYFGIAVKTPCRSCDKHIEAIESRHRLSLSQQMYCVCMLLVIADNNVLPLPC